LYFGLIARVENILGHWISAWIENVLSINEILLFITGKTQWPARQKSNNLGWKAGVSNSVRRKCCQVIPGCLNFISFFDMYLRVKMSV